MAACSRAARPAATRIGSGSRKPLLSRYRKGYRYRATWPAPVTVSVWSTNCHPLAVDRQARAEFGRWRGRGAMSSGQYQVEGVLTGNGVQVVQQELQVPVQLQRHLLHQRRPAAGLVAQQRTGPGQQADEIERASLPDLLARDQLVEEHKLRLLAERRRFVEG